MWRELCPPPLIHRARAQPTAASGCNCQLIAKPYHTTVWCLDSISYHMAAKKKKSKKSSQHGAQQNQSDDDARAPQTSSVAKSVKGEDLIHVSPDRVGYE